MAFGQDATVNGAVRDTLDVASDNDFRASADDKNGAVVDDSNQFFVFAFSDADLPGFGPSGSSHFGATTTATSSDVDVVR